MVKVTIEQEDGTEIVFGELDHVNISQRRPAEIMRNRDGSIAKIAPGRITTLSIVGVSERKKR